ncbi:MAG TPA: hypothetical protein VFR95_12070 [Gemmatimonadaceae bacterium]|nr:hypothetical protein [Gemmatimonadaceae bacterium]
MAQRIRRFGVGQTAKVFGVLYGIMGLIFVPVFALIAAFAPREEAVGFGVGFAIAMPVFYAVIGFIAAAIGCAIYNVVAGWIGGIEVELGPEG